MLNGLVRGEPLPLDVTPFLAGRFPNRTEKQMDFALHA
ncbi:Uncharacterised protein [Chromobacterium vaccinii]|nr:Uncharacterised protein [Chromobacterium vaccinii]